MPDIGKGGGEVDDESASKERGACEAGHLDLYFEEREIVVIFNLLRSHKTW